MSGTASLPPEYVVRVVDAMTGTPIEGARVVVGGHTFLQPGQGCEPGAEASTDGGPSVQTDAAGSAAFPKHPATYRASDCGDGRPCAAQKLTPFVHVAKLGYVSVEFLEPLPEVVRLVRKDAWTVRTGAAALTRALTERKVTKLRNLGSKSARRTPESQNELDERACLRPDGRWSVLLPAFRIDEGEPGVTRVTPRIEVAVDPVSGAIAFVSCDGPKCPNDTVAPAEDTAGPQTSRANAGAPRCLRKRSSFELVCAGNIQPGDPDRVPAVACDTCMVDRDCKEAGARCVRVGTVPCHGPARFECRTPSAACGGKICPEMPELVP